MSDSKITPSWPDTPDRWQMPAFMLVSATFLLWALFIKWTLWMANQVFLAHFGVFDTIVAGPRHGHFLGSRLAWDVEANDVAGLLHPVLLLLMPVYYLFDHPMTLRQTGRLF
jgi:uncharacterized membrane protein